MCRSIQLFALLARGDAAKDLEPLALGHRLAVLRHQSPSPGFEPADRRCSPPAAPCLLQVRVEEVRPLGVRVAKVLRLQVRVAELRVS